MKISELVEYHEVTFTPPAQLPEINDKSKYLGELSCKIGKLKVYKNDEPGFKTFIVTDKDNKTVAFLDLNFLPVPNYAQVKNAYCTIPNNGVMTNLYIFMVRHESVKLISDYHMSKDGEELWAAIIKKNLLNVSVIDLNNGTRYSLADAKKQNHKTKDNVIVTLPNLDKRDDPSHGKLENTQRFMYIAESLYPKLPEDKIVKETVDEVKNEWSNVKQALLENEHLIPRYSYQYSEGP